MIYTIFSFVWDSVLTILDFILYEALFTIKLIIFVSVISIFVWLGQLAYERRKRIIDLLRNFVHGKRGA